MIVISNTTPLIGLAAIQRFDLLQKIFGEILVPQAVYDEVMFAGRNQSKQKGVADISSASWLKIVTVNDRLAVEVLLGDLDIGESETIVLARERNADWVVMDEKKGRRKLDQLRIAKIGTVGVLLKAKELKLIPKIRPELEALQENGFSLSHFVLETVVRQAGE